MLRNLLLRLLCVPLADERVVTIGAARSVESIRDAILEWLEYAKPLFSQFVFTAAPEAKAGSIRLDFASPTSGVAYLRVVGAAELDKAGVGCLEAVTKEAGRAGADTTVVFLNYDVLAGGSGVGAVEAMVDDDQGLPGDPLIIEPRWVAALALERAKPMLPTNMRAAASLGGSPHFQGEPSANAGITVSGNPLPPAFLVGEDSGMFRLKLETMQQRPPVEGTVLLASVFFPPVTHSVRAQKRFYEFFGATKETVQLVEQRAEWERARWHQHISEYQRVDVLDLAQVEEYLAAPEYYQLPLTRSELQEQVENVVGLLAEPNYELRFCTEAVDIPFEILRSEVHVRTDRRNKGQPRQGRVTSIVLTGKNVVDSFEREFWTLHRSGAQHLLDKRDIASWLKQTARGYSGRASTRVPQREEYDVFLCYNSDDWEAVVRVARRLEKVGIRPWLDRWDAPPGVPAVMALESVIGDIDVAAVFVGESGVGPWQRMEIYAWLTKFVERGARVIPALLGSAPKGDKPELPVFLGTMGWVDFRQRGKPTPFEKLLWGVDPSRKPSHSGPDGSIRA